MEGSFNQAVCNPILIENRITMRRINSTFVTIFVALLFASGIRAANAQIGIAAGLNYDSVSDLDIGDVDATFDAASGYHVGLFYDLSLGTVGIRLGAFYRDVGDVEPGDVDLDDIDITDALDNFDLTMIDFPVDIRLNLTATPLIHPYFLFGPVFSIPSSGVDFVDTHLESVLVTGNIGVGLALNIAGISLFPELRYGIGITSLLKDEIELGDVTFENDVQRVNTVMLRLGIIL